LTYEHMNSAGSKIFLK